MKPTTPSFKNILRIVSISLVIFNVVWVENLRATQASLHAEIEQKATAAQQAQIVRKTFTNDLNQSLNHIPDDTYFSVLSFLDSSGLTSQTFRTSYKIEKIYPLSNSRSLIEEKNALHLLSSSGTEIARMEKPQGFVNITLSPDERFFIIEFSTTDKDTYLYTTANLKQIGKRLKDIWATWISPDSSYVILSDGSDLQLTTLKMTDLHTLTRSLCTIKNSALELENVIISPNDKFAIRINTNGSAQIYAVDTIQRTLKKIGDPFTSIELQDSTKTAIQISPNSEFITVCFSNNTAQIYAINTESRSYTPVGSPIQNISKWDVNTPIEISPNNNFIVVHHLRENNSHFFQVYNPKTGQPFNFVLEENHDIWRTHISPDGKYILEEHNGKLSAYYIDSETQAVTRKYCIEDVWNGDIEGIRFSHSGNFFAAANSDYDIDLYKTESGTKIGNSRPIDTDAAREYNFSTVYFLRNDQVMIIDNGKTMDVYCTKDGKLMKELDVYDAFINNSKHNSFIITHEDEHSFTVHRSAQELLSGDVSRTLSPEELLFIYNLSQLDEDLTGKKIVLSQAELKIFTQIREKSPLLTQKLISYFHLIPAEEHEANKNCSIKKLVAKFSSLMQQKNHLPPAQFEILQQELRSAFLKKITEEGAQSSKKSLLAFGESLHKSNSLVEAIQLSALRTLLSTPARQPSSLAQLARPRTTPKNHICSQSSSHSNCGICGATMSRTSSLIPALPILGKRSTDSTEHEERGTEQEKKSRHQESALTHPTSPLSPTPAAQQTPVTPPTNTPSPQSTQQRQAERKA